MAQNDWNKVEKQISESGVSEFLERDAYRRGLQRALELIGEDEEMATAEVGLSPDEVFMPEDLLRQVRNDLRAELRTRIQEELDNGE